VDVELAGSVLPGWLLAAGYTFNNNMQLVPDPVYGLAVSTQTPRHLLKAWTSKQLPGRWRRWSVGASLQAQSRNYTHGLWCSLNSQGACLGGGLQHYYEVQSSYAVVSPRIGYQFDSKWQVALSVNNLFDKSYYQTISAPSGGNWYGEPRSFTVRVDGKF
jgi:outer membrane receptor for ferric coprogen and ferric-rhodotorulic acid